MITHCNCITTASNTITTAAALRMERVRLLMGGYRVKPVMK